MAKYSYKAKTSPKETIEGEIEAESKQECLFKLNRMGYFPVRIDQIDAPSGERRTFGIKKISQTEIIEFTRQLASLIESGVNIVNALNIIHKQAQNRCLKITLNDIIARIKDGNSLSASLNHYPHLFPSVYTATIHSGEISGNIAASLKRLAEFGEKEEEFKNSVRAALTYPFFIFIVSVLTVIILLGFVIPRLVVMFDEMGQALPIPTKIIILTSRLLQNYWWLILGVMAAGIFIFQSFAKSRQGRITLDRTKLKLPVMGDIFLKNELVRLMRTLSLLISSGIPVVQAIEISVSLLRNNIIKTEIQKCKDIVTAGSSFSKSLDTTHFFPVFVTSIISVGEETGSLDKAFLRIADEYERQVDRTLKTIARLLEPIIILGMGLLVAFIVLSMLLPIFQINLTVR